MDWLTFVSKLVESLSWPIVALILGLVFRRKLLELLPTLRKFKAGPLEAEFELDTKRALASAEAAQAQIPVIVQGAQVDAVGTSNREVIAKLREARGDPTGVILDGWAKLDGELFRLGVQTGLGFAPVENTEKVYRAVIESDTLPSETKALVRDLRLLRNKVAHSRVMPTPEAAQDYLLAVDRAIELIVNFRKNLPNYGPGNR